jgi:predicted  nucleic acid-binding Zn-ribbon protein
MLFRRKQRPNDTTPSQPPWRTRFDEAVAMIRSRPQPDWVNDRLTDLEAALTAAHHDDQNLAKTIEQLDPSGTADQLKQALRAADQRLPMADGVDDERRIAALRRRYDTVNEMMNRRTDMAQRVLDSIADLELLAIETLHDNGSTERGMHDLDNRLERLDIDLRALESARQELRPW